MVRTPVDEEHSAKPAGAEFWHIWTVYIPRRSITGKFRAAFGDDGRRWVYKRLALDDPKDKPR